MDIGSVPGEIGILPEYREVTGTPGNLMGLNGPSGGSREEAKGSHAPPPPKSKLDKEGVGAPPFSFSLSLLPQVLVQHGKGGVLLPVGVGLLLARPLPGRTSSPLLLYIQGQVAPHRHNN